MSRENATELAMEKASTFGVNYHLYQRFDGKWHVSKCKPPRGVDNYGMPHYIVTPWSVRERAGILANGPFQGSICGLLA